MIKKQAKNKFEDELEKEDLTQLVKFKSQIKIPPSISRKQKFLFLIQSLRSKMIGQYLYPFIQLFLLISLKIIIMYYNINIQNTLPRLNRARIK